MKKILSIINLGLAMAMILMISLVHPEESITSVDSKISFVNSKMILVEDTVNVTESVSSEEEKEEEDTVVEEPKKESTPKKVEVKEEVVEAPKQEEVPLTSNNSSTITAFVGDKFTAQMSGYGADIGTHTASGFDITQTIYYSDPTYGTVRILSGGKEYPYGTIVKVTGSRVGDFYGIVLDRGGNIGRGEGKKFAFDLLFATSREALSFEVSTAQFEIVRVGY